MGFAYKLWKPSKTLENLGLRETFSVVSIAFQYSMGRCSLVLENLSKRARFGVAERRMAG
jgi:hypothetical protein